MWGNIRFSKSKWFRKIITYKKEILIFLLLAFFTFHVLSKFVLAHLSDIAPCSDCRFYFAMSEGTLPSEGAFYFNRVLTPFLAGLLPFSTPTNFLIINFIGFLGASFVLFLFLRKLKYSDNLSFLGSLIFLVNHTIMNSGWLVDALFYFFFILGFYAILLKNDRLYFLSLLIGVFNKELILLLVPLYFIMNKNIWKTFYLSILPVIIEVFLFFQPDIISTRINPGTYGLTEFFKNFFPHKINSISSTFTIVWIFALLGYKNAPKFVKKSCLLLPFLLIFIPISQTPDRMAFLMFPIVVPLTLQFLKDHVFR